MGTENFNKLLKRVVLVVFNFKKIPLDYKIKILLKARKTYEGFEF